MKILQSVLVLLIVAIFTGTVFASSKYDPIMSDSKGVAQINKAYAKGVDSSPILHDYLNLVISKDSLLKLVRENKFDKEKSDFISKNIDFMIKYLQIRMCTAYILTLDQKTIDNQLIYVTGVIKDKHAQLARNGVEYEQEKGFMRNMPLYKFWENYHNPDNAAKMVSEELDRLYTLMKRAKK